MRKISIIGAGNVGSTTAFRICQSALADVVLVDIVEGLAQGKAMDISNAMGASGSNKKIIGTTDFSKISGSSLIIVTAGLTRKPGMSRDDLLESNARIIRDVSEKIKKFSSSAIVLMVTNPLDIMTYLAFRVTGFDSRRVFGMAGVLDSARFTDLIAEELGVERAKIKAFVLGGHGDLMVPLSGHTAVDGRPLEQILSKEKIQKLVDETKTAGAKIVSSLKVSAYYGPCESILTMAEAIVENRNSTFCASVYVSGQYGLDGIYIGLPAKIGKEGVEQIVELELRPDEKGALNKSAESIRSSIEKLKL